MLVPVQDFHVTDHFDPTAQAVLYHGDCLELLADVPTGSQKLIVTSPP